MSEWLTIESTTDSPEELEFLQRIVENLNDHSRKLAYADWLKEQGRKDQAEFLNDYTSAMEAMDSSQFPDFETQSKAWVRATGAELCKSLLSREATSKYLEELLDLAMPSLVFEQPMAYGADQELTLDAKIPIGSTKLFGLPDLPTGTPWPRQKDCNAFYDPDEDIDPETYCSFVCQINFEELAGTLPGGYLPQSGLLSVFSCAEFDEIGMTDVYVTFHSDTGNLERIAAPEELLEEEDPNHILDAVPLRLIERLDLPTTADSQDRGFLGPIRPNGDKTLASTLGETDADLARHEFMEGFLGFTRPSSGDDPLPSLEHCRLMSLCNSADQKLYLCIRRDDLKAARFDKVEFVWIDFD